MRPATDQDISETNSYGRVQLQLNAVKDELARNPPAKAAYECNAMTTAGKRLIPGVCFFKSKSAKGWAFSNFFRCVVMLRITDDLRDGVYVFGSSEHAYQWVARIYPNDKSEASLLKWCGGGEYDRPAAPKQPKKAKAGDSSKSPRNASSAGAVKEANCAAGLHAKLLVGKNPAFALPNLARNPHGQGLTLEEEYSFIWRPILTAKYTWTPELRLALVRTAPNLLVEYSKSFNRQSMGGFVKDGGASFKRPESGELSREMVDEWRTDRWGGNVIEHPTARTLHAFGFNVMGDFLARVRAIASNGQAHYTPWPNNVETGEMRPFNFSLVGRSGSSSASSSSSSASSSGSGSLKGGSHYRLAVYPSKSLRSRRSRRSIRNTRSTRRISGGQARSRGRSREGRGRSREGRGRSRDRSREGRGRSRGGRGRSRGGGVGRSRGGGARR